MASKRELLVVTICSPVNQTLYKSQLLGVLDTSMVKCFLSRFALTACRVTKFSCVKLLDEKETKKENEFSTFGVEWFQTLAITH